jgi:ubiquinone/menaquinone biosynthesis C-methylase UbiE
VSKDYNAQVAGHYSKYRPPLHEIILFKALDQNRRFKLGLDVGCGTGKSSRPLRAYCEKIFGLDPSRSMIDRAESDPSITYICGNEALLAEFHSGEFDLVTFAGSLSYSKNATLKKELKRICRSDAQIVVYDFEVLMSDFLSGIEMKLSPIDSSGYNHAVNISDWKEFTEEVVRKEQVHLSLSAEELAHFILSHSTWYEELVARFKEQNPYSRLTHDLKSHAEKLLLPATIFYSRYSL